MANIIPHVSPPVDKVFRVNRWGRPLFRPPDWENAGKEGKFNGRYGDPAGEMIPREYRFRMIYCCTSRAAALGEVIAGKGLRPDFNTIANISKEIAFESPFDPEYLKFYISEDWRS